MRARTLVVGVVLVMGVSVPQLARAQASQLPITDFLDAQRVGGAGVQTDFTIWIDPASTGRLRFDAFGKLNERFVLGVGTTFDGSVTVRALADGTAQVSVRLHTTNGLCWGAVPPGPTDNAFGSGPTAVVAGAPAALGNGLLKLVFTMPSVDSPMPSYFDLTFYGIPGYHVEGMYTTISCEGVLHPASGYAEGTAGRAHTIQTGLFFTGVRDGCPPEQDASCFPAERVVFRPVGSR